MAAEMKNWTVVSIIILAIWLGVGCGAETFAIPTAVGAHSTPLATNTVVPIVPTITPRPSKTPAPPVPTITIPPTITLRPEDTHTPSPTFTPIPPPPSYQVVYILPDDFLNVRQGAGAESSIVGILLPGTTGISVDAGTVPITDTEWVFVNVGTVSGWANSNFLTETIPPADFCLDPAAQAALTNFIAQIETPSLASNYPVAHDQRGLRIRINWWNPELKFNTAYLAPIFADSNSYNWGVQDGSGFPIEGSFSQIIFPLLQKELLGATETGCNEILHGGTAGLVQLPEEYAGINYFSVYRQNPDNEFDWGTWVVGIERWQGQYIVSFLVHFNWEI